MPSSPLMRAVVALAPGDPDVLEVREVPRPEPSAGEVLIRVAAAGINPVDAKTRSGAGAGKFLDELRPASADLAAALARDGAEPTTPTGGGFPWVPGWDVAGTVEAVGFGVSRFAAGDRVCGLVGFPRAAGTYAEYVVAHVSQLSRSPRSLTDIESAALPLAGLTAWQAMADAGDLETNRRVVITGASGGVGHIAVQVAADLGAHVIAVTSTENVDFVRGLGAAEVLNRTHGDWTEQLDAPVDLVVDGSGHDLRAAAYATLVPGGRFVSLVSSARGEPTPDTILAPRVFVAPDGLELQLLTGTIERGMLRPHVSATFPLEQAAEAHRQIESGTTRGKIVLTVGD
ncbi:MAG: NADP-dependent oxidoreductase [Patulibacter sp.]|nr:NADP-dependent oxidoreductase [Patulibacter sp.]